ncbi:spindle and kinetochore-associated protein 2-like [Gigantopelta aegis]|uniref:spindle and kinetochore-associated protein 2-like n=1 Tax=Gigantopelta aegis TaxID=1735272 RepID=UPI001B8890A9|nr:spindle and kinetochore-associated protein 2-like [Gigantopelta aegis]
MEKTVETLEAMFQKADSDLNYLSRKLEFEFENTANGKEQMNPVRMMQKIGEIKKEYAGIVQEAAAIHQTQKEAMDYFRSQLLVACQMLQKLENRTGSEGMEQPEAIGQLEQMLGIDLSQVDSDPKPSSPIPVEEVGGNSNKMACPVDSTCISAESSMNRPVSPVSRRACSRECIEIDQAEFESVSSLVRRRVKLADVNIVYNRLWTHFKEEGNSTPLSTSDMYQLGWKITGSTGEAKLKVLRALKLLKLSSKGEVTLT